MQFVHNRRVPIEIPSQQSLHWQLRVVDVAVVVVENVLAPVRRSAQIICFAFLVDLVAVVPVRVAITTVGVGSIPACADRGKPMPAIETISAMEMERRKNVIG